MAERKSVGKILLLVSTLLQSLSLTLLLSLSHLHTHALSLSHSLSPSLSSSAQLSLSLTLSLCNSHSVLQTMGFGGCSCYGNLCWWHCGGTGSGCGKRGGWAHRFYLLLLAACSGWKNLGWPWGLTPVRILSQALAVLNEPERYGMLWEGGMCVCSNNLNQPGPNQVKAREMLSPVRPLSFCCSSKSGSKPWVCPGALWLQGLFDMETGSSDVAMSQRMMGAGRNERRAPTGDLRGITVLPALSLQKFHLRTKEYISADLGHLVFGHCHSNWRKLINIWSFIGHPDFVARKILSLVSERNLKSVLACFSLLLEKRGNFSPFIRSITGLWKTKQDHTLTLLRETCTVSFHSKSSLYVEMDNLNPIEERPSQGFQEEKSS